jgi:hypothetical protein
MPREGAELSLVEYLLERGGRNSFDGPEGQGFAIVRRLLQFDLPDFANSGEFRCVPCPTGLVEHFDVEMYQLSEVRVFRFGGRFGVLWAEPPMLGCKVFNLPHGERQAGHFRDIELEMMQP